MVWHWDEEREPDENPALVSRPSAHPTFSVSSLRSQGPAFPCSTEKSSPHSFVPLGSLSEMTPSPGFSSQSSSSLTAVDTSWTFVVSSKELKN